MKNFLHKKEFLATEKLLNSFKVYLKFVKNFSDHTISSYVLDINQFFKYIKDLSEDSENIITSQTIYNYLIYLQTNNKLSKRSINRKISSLRKFFSFLKKEKIIKFNPLEGIEHFKTEKKTPVFLNYDEIIQFLDGEVEEKNLEKKLRDNAIVELLYSTGLRVSELVSLNLEDIDFKENIIRVKGKGGKERVVIFGKVAKDKLLKYIKFKGIKKANSPLFLNLKGKRITQRAVQLIIKERAVKLGIQKNITPHVLRHTFATHLLNQGMDIRIIQGLLGHSSLSTTQIYTQVGISKLIEIYDKAHPKSNN